MPDIRTTTADPVVPAEDEAAQPISIRKLDRLETTNHCTNGGS